ncbi:MAG: 30S ribosomal protein S7 [Acidobacteriota bacterium]|nr:30S ribosomal protein S7 [Blastocatellia bacterium]MDW8241235.1 30S ribosomal protein S7 [Acidobacteriota bacterium]
MPRKRVIEKRPIAPDVIYNSPLVTKFINCMMWDGKKSVAERIFYEAMERIKKRTKEDPLKVFKQAVENTKPKLEVRSRRVGGATYQVPVDVNPYRQTSLAIRWLITFARSRGEKMMAEKLAAELLDASQGRGNAIKKRDDVHRMAEANRAFSHYRW